MYQMTVRDENGGWAGGIRDEQYLFLTYRINLVGLWMRLVPGCVILTESCPKPCSRG